MVRTAIAVAAASVATASSLFTISLYAHDRAARQNDINQAVCLAVVKLDTAITDTLKRSLANIPKVQYYREHPAELRAQQADIRRSLKKFVPPPECGNKSNLTRR